MTPGQIRPVAEALLFLAFCGGLLWIGYHFTREHYEKVIVEMKDEAETAASEARQRQMDLQLNAEAQHAKDQLLINQRDAYLDSLRPSPTITCRRDPPPVPSANGASGVAATGTVEYTGISPEDKSRIIATYKRCAQLNIDTIELNNSLAP